MKGMALFDKMMMRWWVFDRYCTECKQDTTQRTFIVRPIFAIPLAIVTLGGYLFVWIMEMLSRDPSYCDRCGQANAGFRLDRRGNVHGP
jgi:hypothetical protein